MNPEKHPPYFTKNELQKQRTLSIKHVNIFRISHDTTERFCFGCMFLNCRFPVLPSGHTKMFLKQKGTPTLFNKMLLFSNVQTISPKFSSHPKQIRFFLKACSLQVYST
ncbi:unnamed protein product [Ixodes persulcatus]